jgi:isoquinoline 1-oxidoreductase beta subunit
VQLVWSRSDDMRYGHLQPAAVHRLYAGIDAQGRLVAWGHRQATTLHNMNAEPTAEQKRDPVLLRNSSWGIYDVPYAIPNIETFHVPVDAPARIGPWRAVYAPSSVFAREAFLDEVAQALSKDPVQFRLELLGEGAAPGTVAPAVTMGDLTLDRERLRGVIRLAAEKAGWGQPLPPGRARGFACNLFEGGTAAAYVVEVSKKAAKGGLPFQVHRVVAAVDCGVVINPAGVAQQVEGGVLWGLSNLKTEVTFKAGQVVQSGYSDFEVARFEDTPVIETHLVPSHGDAPTGLGEPAVLPLPPAVAGALHALTGKRFRNLPIASL